MNNNFRKLKIVLPKIDQFYLSDEFVDNLKKLEHIYTQEIFIETEENREIFHIMKKYEKGVVSYFEDERDILNSFSNCLPEELREFGRTQWQILKGVGIGIPPHTDDDRHCVINFYLKTNDEITSYYEDPKMCIAYDRTVESEIVESYVFNDEWVTLHSSFQAKDGDTYLLNTDSIHGVSNFTENKKRITVSIGFPKKYFNEVEQILRKHDLVE